MLNVPGLNPVAGLLFWVSGSGFLGQGIYMHAGQQNVGTSLFEYAWRHPSYAVSGEAGFRA
jgi:hypothetical protein